jgi:hypothetical protein
MTQDIHVAEDIKKKKSYAIHGILFTSILEICSITVKGGIIKIIAYSTLSKFDGD